MAAAPDLLFAEVTEHALDPELVRCAERGSALAPGCTMRSPQDGSTLVEGLSLTVPPGVRTLVSGPNEVARNALFRATAGRWSAGTGRVVPRLAVLDRPALTLGPEQAAHALTLLAAASITAVTFASDPALGDLHDARLDLFEGGRWTWSPLRAESRSA